MSDYTDFLSTIRDYTARPDFSDTLIDSFIRQAETSMYRVLRVREMLVTADVNYDTSKNPLPSSWLEFSFVRSTDGKPWGYLSSTNMFAKQVLANYQYTIRGDYWYLGGTTPTDQIFLVDDDGNYITDELGNFLISEPIPVTYDLTIEYFKQPDHFSASSGPSWLYSKYYDLLLSAVLVPAFQYALEPAKAQERLAMAASVIESANMLYQKSNISGGRIKRPNNRVRMR